MHARPYQQQAVDLIQLNKVNLLCLPMRAGKTFIMALAINQYKFKKVLVVVGYRKIVEQLAKYFPSHTHILAGMSFDHSAQVHLASFQTLANREINLQEYDCIIQDEYHSRTSKTAANIVFQSSCTVLLFTGTPLTDSNKLLVKNIDNFIQPITVKELIDNKWLAPTRFLSNSTVITDHSKELSTTKQDFDENVVRQIIQKEHILQNIIELINSKKLDTEHKTLIYVNYIATANELYALLKHHHNVFIVHSQLTNKQQTKAIQEYQAVKFGILINVRALSLGFDSPTTDTLIYAFFTKIHSLCLQILWRASTIDPDNPNKIATVYDMTGQLAFVNPYTDFKSYSNKLSCKDQCAKQYPTDPLAQYFCMESCTSNPILVPCIGKLSPSLAKHPFISNYTVFEGKPCMESRPVWEYEYKSQDISLGLIRKWSKCLGCGCISYYDVQTMTTQTVLTEVYREDKPTNTVIIIFNESLHKAFAVFDKLKSTTYIKGFYSSSTDIITTATKYFGASSFTIVANRKLSNLPDLTVLPALSNAIDYVSWDEASDNSNFIKYLIRAKLTEVCSEHAIKPGYIHYTMQLVNSDNEKQVLTFLNKSNLDRAKVVKFFKKFQD